MKVSLSDNIFKKQSGVWLISMFLVFTDLALFSGFPNQIMSYLGLEMFIITAMTGIYAPILGAVILCMKFEVLPKNNTIIKYYFNQPIKYGVEG